MLTIPGRKGCLCDGPTRRELLRAGSVGLFGLNLANFCHWKKFARFNPNKPTEPARNSSRLVGPSHKQPLRPGIVSMKPSSKGARCLVLGARENPKPETETPET